MPRLPTRTSTRNPMAAVEQWAIDPETPPTLGADGKYQRPAGPAPVEGYSWNNVRGVWFVDLKTLSPQTSSLTIVNSPTLYAP